MTPKYTTLSIAAALALTACKGTEKEKPAPEKKPNILFILTDDQRADALGCAGNPIVQTPNMDKLAASGVRFTNAFVSSPISAASRASILTGLYERSHGFTFGTPPLANAHMAQSYPALLREAGYHTGFIGKYGIQTNEGVADSVFDYFVPLRRSPYMKVVEGDSIHLTDLIGRYAKEYLSTRTDGQPFCLSVSFHAPHAEDHDPRQYTWPKTENEMYKDVAIPPPPNGDSAFFMQHPEWVRNSISRERWHWRFDTPEKYQEMVKGHYRMISGVDRVIGEIRNELEELGLADNTLIILMGDNGYFLGERGLAGKWYMYELSLRVPLIIYDPRKEKPLVLDNTALNIDIAPTILDYAGVNIPENYQGMSLVTLIENPDIPWRETFFCEHLFDHAGIPKSEGVRTPMWKYFRWIDHPGHEELYNIDADPAETRNLAGEVSFNNKLLKYRQMCDSMINVLK